MNFIYPNNVDIYHNEVIIITPCIQTPYNIKYISTENNILTFDLYKCPHNHVFIYSLDIQYNENIKYKIMIDNCIYRNTC